MGCSYSTVGDLFGVASSTACQIFNDVIRVIDQVFHDEYVTLPTTEDEWRAELNAFLKDWGFPCVGARDSFHVYISSNLKNLFNFKKRYSVTNMGLVAANKRFLWAGVIIITIIIIIIIIIIINEYFNRINPSVLESTVILGVL